MHRRLGIVALLCALRASPLFADDAKPAPADPAAKVAGLEAVVAVLAAEKSDSALAGVAPSARTMAADLKDSSLRTRLVAVVGKILDATREESAERSAIRALGALGDPAGFRFLLPFLTPPTLEAVAAASKMRSDESVPVLMDVVRGSRDLILAEAAVKAFSTFGRNHATRVSILQDLVESVRKDQPGRERPRANPIRYEALSGAMTATLNALTGQNVVAADDWFDLVDKRASDLSALFGAAPEAPAAKDVEKASKELTDEVARLEATVGQHLDGKSDDALVADLGALAPLAARIAEPSVRSRLTDLAGRVLEGTRNPTVERAALQALGTLADPAGFRFVRRLLPRTPSRDGRSLMLEAVDAAGRVKSGESVPVLLALVADAEPRVAMVALEAFSGFGTHKETREKILLSLVETVRKTKGAPSAPGSPSPGPVREAETYRYQLLSSSLPPTLNAMTGRKLGTPEQWYELIARHTDNPAGLFLN